MEKLPSPRVSCRMCGENSLSVVRDFGSAALCRENPLVPSESVQRIQYLLAACGACGLIQLLETLDLEWLQPPDEFATFRDPERHLDDLCQAIFSQLTSPDIRVLGLTYKDAPVLDRFRQAGYKNTVL